VPSRARRSDPRTIQVARRSLFDLFAVIRPHCDAVDRIEPTRPHGRCQKQTLPPHGCAHAARTPTPAAGRLVARFALVLLLIGCRNPAGDFLGPAGRVQKTGWSRNAGRPQNNRFSASGRDHVGDRRGLSNVHADLGGRFSLVSHALCRWAETTCAACTNPDSACRFRILLQRPNVDLSGGCASCHQEHKGPKGNSRPRRDPTEAAVSPVTRGDIGPRR